MAAPSLMSCALPVERNELGDDPQEHHCASVSANELHFRNRLGEIPTQGAHLSFQRLGRRGLRFLWLAHH